jgi:hypothetical protein
MAAAVVARWEGVDLSAPPLTESDQLNAQVATP